MGFNIPHDAIIEGVSVTIGVDPAHGDDYGAVVEIINWGGGVLEIVRSAVLKPNSNVIDGEWHESPPKVLLIAEKGGENG